jgi:A/G-specific adenine glycosylase
VAYRENSVDQLPVKSKKMVKKDRYFLYFVFKKGDQTWLRQRAAKDIWQNLYEFPQTEPEQLPEHAPEALRLLTASGYPTPASAKVQLSKTYRQTLTHRQVAALFALVEIQDPHWKPSPEWIPAPWSNTLPEVALPKVIAGFWKEKALFFQQPNLFS